MPGTGKSSIGKNVAKMLDFNFIDLDKMIEKKSDINAKSRKGYTPLYFACKSGRLEIVRLLTENNADINAQSVRGETPLMIATTKGYQKIRDILVDYGATRIIL